MKLLNLFAKFFKKTQEEEINYLTLILTPAEILASIWAFEGENPRVIGFDKRAFTTVDNLVHQAAVTIDKAASLAQSDVTKVTFGLSHFWLEDNQLTRETSKILKTLSEDLELEAQAYISLASAINHLLKVEDSITPHAVLIGKFHDFLEVHLIENNKVADTKIAKGKTDLEKIVALITQLKKEDKDLPSKIVLYGDGQSLIDKIKDATWQDLFRAKNSGIDTKDEKSFETRKREPRPEGRGNLFVHEPKINFLEDSDLARAVVFAQAQDILGHEVILQQDSEIKSADKKESLLGFVEGEDILLTKGEAQAPTEEKITVAKEEKEQLPIERQHPLEKENYAVENVQNNKPKEDFIEVAATVGWFPKLLGLFKTRPSAKLMAIIPGALIVAAVIASFIVSQFFTAVDITIKVQSKSLEKDFKNQIDGEEITSQAEGSQKAVATGIKKIGQAAKGPVTVFNWTTAEFSFPQDTVIISKNGIKFSLDNEVSVASRSASVPGQANTNVTAADVGPSGNIAQGQDFTFQKYDELLYSARSESDFAGGDEKDVTVVSAQDQDKLAKSLKDTLTEKAKALLKEKTQGKNFDDQALILKVLKSESDKKVDEEASLVNLSMTIEASQIVYDQPKLKENLVQSIKDQVPENSQVRAQDIEILDLATKRVDNSLTLTGRFKALLVPKFNEEELKEKIAGKSQKTARSIIKETLEVADVEFKYSPNLPITSSIPRNKPKIKFNIEAI